LKQTPFDRQTMRKFWPWAGAQRRTFNWRCQPERCVQVATGPVEHLFETLKFWMCSAHFLT
jgi:hypothetical protein